MTFLGYSINPLSVPAMALARNWPTLATLILSERVGRAIRKPTVESMLSYTKGTPGRGWVYALNTALDEIGATLGPLIGAFVFFQTQSYRKGYALLICSAVLALASLTVARIFFPLRARLEEERAVPISGFTSAYWMYAGGCFAAGLTSFELISFHLSSTHARERGFRRFSRHLPVLVSSRGKWHEAAEKALKSVSSEGSDPETGLQHCRIPFASSTATKPSRKFFGGGPPRST